MIDWWGPVINESYARSEAGFITLLSLGRMRCTHPGSAGRPLAGADVRILDDDGDVLPPFEPGLIYCRQTGLPGLHLHQPAGATAGRSTATGSWRSATSATSTATAISTSATASPTW